MRVVLVDYGMGNLGSILNMLRKIGVPADVADSEGGVKPADVLILPGVGAFDAGMESIDRLGLHEVLHYKACIERVPILGICLGMQLITRNSEEGRLSGFGWIPAATVRFRFPGGDHELRIPHIGWNRIIPTVTNSALFDDLAEPRAYFVHSYHVACEDRENVVAWTHYGYDFPSIVSHANVWGMQFHPEKSHRFGMYLLRNFFRVVRNA